MAGVVAEEAELGEHDRQERRDQQLPPRVAEQHEHRPPGHEQRQVDGDPHARSSRGDDRAALPRAPAGTARRSHSPGWRKPLTDCSCHHAPSAHRQGSPGAGATHRLSLSHPGSLLSIGVDRRPAYRRSAVRTKARRVRGIERLPYVASRGTGAPLRIGVLASIAHRTPPRHYGPWEQVASTLAEGLVALGHDVTLFATADSRTTARLHAEAPRGYEEDPGVDAKVYEGLHNAAAFERARRVRRGEQPVRLHAADLQQAGVDTRGDHHPRLLLGADTAGLPRLRRHRALRGDQRRGPAPGPDLRRDDPPRHRPLPLHLPGSTRRLPAVPGPHPSRQGHAPGGRGRAPGQACRW